MSIFVRFVLGEWMVGEERHRDIEWSDGTYEHQRIWVEDGRTRWVGVPLSQMDIWDRYPNAIPAYERQARFLQRQEERRRNVWWRRVFREAGWRVR